MASPDQPTWQEISRKMRQYRDMTMAQVEPPVPDVLERPSNVLAMPQQLLSDAEFTITETAPELLLASLSTGKLTSKEVTNAFLRRAALAQKLVNCVTELLPGRALARARELDAYYAEHKMPIGPLHGLPISVKEHVGMKGLDRNVAFVSWVGKMAEDDAHLLQILWKAGCVFHVRTTEPQSLVLADGLTAKMSIETSNNIYGTTVNPHNTSLTSGGSSGGEGALVALRGSCLSVSTDIGGSIRVPAGNCGNYGFRPTSHRLPLLGLGAPQMGSEQIWPVVGPQSSTLEGIKLFMKTVISSKPWINDPSLVPLPWRTNQTHLRGAQKLKIEIIWSNGVVKPQPPVQRALKEVVEKLRGVPEVELVDWKPWKHDYAWQILSKLYLPDGGREHSSYIESSGEPWIPLVKYIIKDNPYVKDQSVYDVWHWTMEREIYRGTYAHVWNETATGEDANGDPEGAVDVILCPVTPGPAPVLGTSRYWGYTSQWNLLDYPALVFPVTRVDIKADVVEEGYAPLNKEDEYYHENYEPERFRDAPVSLQLVGRNFEDEKKVIEIFEYIKEKIGLPFVDPHAHSD
ncbi:hypothetical protein MMC13_007908 [Lambiella insularis]|nr:hypothetical protein [Lambiella insularis]